MATYPDREELSHNKLIILVQTIDDIIGDGQCWWVDEEKIFSGNEGWLIHRSKKCLT